MNSFRHITSSSTIAPVKGVILAGGRGSRLSPLTLGVSKQLLPIFDKPTIFYPLSTLIFAGVREVLLVCSNQSLSPLQSTLGDGSQFGMSIEYALQDDPLGLPHAMLEAEDFVSGGQFAMILGDNLFYGRGLGGALSDFEGVDGAHVFAFQSSAPQDFGVLELDSTGEIIGIEEKPLMPKSNLVVTGLYFFDSSAFSLAKTLTPSKRGELEIVDLLNLYLDKGSLGVTVLPPGTSWLDTGTFERIYDASSFVRALQTSSGQKIGDPLLAARSRGWI